MSDHYYIGVMSGTSFDGVDTVMVDFKDSAINIIAHHSTPFSSHTREKLLAIADPTIAHSLQDVYALDTQLGYLYAESVSALIAQSKIKHNQIKAIGSHGQTIRHFPNQNPGFTVQIGDPNIIAAQTGITTVADFRRRDIAHGGQGAPLAPAFHHHFFHSPAENRAVLNIGGFANITLLPKQGKTSGFDTGPGNCFIDAWALRHLHQPYDNKGQWAASGKIHADLLNRLLSHPFFDQKPPKSTGRDEFNAHWLTNMLADYSSLSPEDIQATLTELTAVSIARWITDVNAVYVCGGGAYNDYLLSRLATHLPGVSVQTTQAWGLDPQLVESCLMAWLASRTLNKQPIDLGHITGSKEPVILGGVYFA
jgi:anhydro-N-acetylmuramic acid kinase